MLIKKFLISKCGNINVYNLFISYTHRESQIQKICKLVDKNESYLVDNYHLNFYLTYIIIYGRLISMLFVILCVL